jgi:hypothetical protein
MPLAEAIDALYAALAHVPRPTAIDACPHCFAASDATALLAPVPLRELTADALRPYTANVMLTVGAEADLRYFLPRILHLAVVDDFDYPDLEGIAAQVRRAGWASWPEREAVRTVWRALWAQTLAAHPSEPAVDTVLCAIGNAEDDVRPYLAVWETALDRGDGAAAAQLWEFITVGAERTADGGWRLLDPYWDDRGGAVVDWLATRV